MLLNDMQIEQLCLDRRGKVLEKPMIRPFVNYSVKESMGIKRISYGLSSAGYDIRLAKEELKQSKDIVINQAALQLGLSIANGIDQLGALRSQQTVDPKASSDLDFQRCELFTDDSGTYTVIQPLHAVLGHSMEVFNIPNNVVGVAHGKSTYARSFLHVLVTPLEPGWRGQLVVEIANVSSNAVRLYVEEGIAQIQFMQIHPPAVSYADRAGKYQDQLGTTLGKV